MAALNIESAARGRGIGAQVAPLRRVPVANIHRSRTADWGRCPERSTHRSASPNWLNLYAPVLTGGLRGTAQ